MASHSKEGDDAQTEAEVNEAPVLGPDDVRKPTGEASHR